MLRRRQLELPENFHRFFDGPDRYEAPEGGESFGQVRDRDGRFLEELARRPEYADGQILLATHGAALAGLLCYIRRAPLATTGAWAYTKTVRSRR